MLSILLSPRCTLCSQKFHNNCLVLVMIGTVGRALHLLEQISSENPMVFFP
jgi:hypothetical protein